MSVGYDGVKKLAKEYPNWLKIVKICFEIAKESKEAEGRFTGTWVLKRARKEGIKDWFPNLRRLVKYGILKQEFSTRGKKRAYYTMPDPEGVERALQELRYLM
jgi:hypothetical protein